MASDPTDTATTMAAKPDGIIPATAVAPTPTTAPTSTQTIHSPPPSPAQPGAVPRLPIETGTAASTSPPAPAAQPRHYVPPSNSYALGPSPPSPATSPYSPTATETEAGGAYQRHAGYAGYGMGPRGYSNAHSQRGMNGPQGGYVQNVNASYRPRTYDNEGGEGGSGVGAWLSGFAKWVDDVNEKFAGVVEGRGWEAKGKGRER